MEQHPIYNFLKENNLTTKDEATFLKEYSDPTKARELHTFMQENGLTQKDYDSFYGEYFTPKGAATEGQPATSGNASSGPIKPYRGGYKREETRPVSPVTIAPKQPKERVGGLIIGEESEIPQKVQKELKTQVAKEEVLRERFDTKYKGAPSVEGYYGELTADQKRAAQNYDPLKQAQDAVEYDNLKVATKDWATSKGIGEVSKAISEGRTKEAFATAQDDYLESISDPNKRNSERAKIEELRAKPVEQLTQTDKDYLREINDKAINAYAAMEKVKIRELMGDADVQAYTDIASNLNTQFASVNKRLNDLKNSNLSQEEKRVRSMELEATAQRLQEKYNALTQETGVTQEQLALLNESYRNLQYINNADEANKLAFGAAERAVIDKEIKQRRKDEGPVADFMNSLTNTVVSGLLSTAQVPKVLGDMVGDEDYDAFDKVYDSLAASKATLSKEMGRKEGFEKLPLYAQIPTMLGEGIGSVALLAGGGAAIGGGSLGVTAAAFLTMEADMYEEMKNLGLSPQEAAKYATITSTLLGAVETIVPDAEYFDAKLASRSVIAAMRKGATNKEAINLALKEVLPSAMEYISRTGLSGVKEAGEESVGAISEGLLKNSINAIEGREVFKGSLNLDNVAEQALMGFVTGGALAAAGRMVASRRSEVQESALNALADNPTVFEAALENDPTLESERSVVDEAAKIRAAWKAIPSFNSLNENVQNHIVSEALRVKQLTKAAKEAGADESAVAKEISDANANILYAQGKNRIRGEKEVPSPTMEWEGEAVKPKTQVDDSQDKQGLPSEIGGGETVVEAQPNQGASAEAVSANRIFFKEKELKGLPNAPSDFVLREITTNSTNGLSSNFFNNVFKSPSFPVKEYSELDVPTRLNVLSSVLSSIKDDKVFNSIVPFIPVDMVNNFLEKKLSSEDILKDNTVLVNLLSSDNSFNVLPIVIDAIKSASAIRGTEISSRFFRGGLGVVFPTIRTIDEIPSEINSSISNGFNQSPFSSDGFVVLGDASPAAKLSINSRFNGGKLTSANDTTLDNTHADNSLPQVTKQETKNKEITRQEAEEEAAMPTLTQEEEVASEAEFQAAIDEVKAIDPTLTEDEADQAATLVQSGETAEEAIAEARQMAEMETTLDEVLEAEDIDTKVRRLAAEYLDAMGQGKYTPKQQAIIEEGIKTTAKSFAEFGDRNLITNGMAKAYFSAQGMSLDQIAHAASESSGMEIEPQDIVELILEYPNGLNGRSARAAEINAEYQKATGKNINTRAAKAILNKGGKNVSKNTEALMESIYSVLEQDGLVTPDGQLDLDKLSELIDDEGYFTQFPLGLTKDEYNELKKHVKENPVATGENILSLDEEVAEVTQAEEAVAPEVAVSEAEAQQTTESDIFAAVDAEPTTPTEKAAARRASKAKFGKEAYEKAVKITKNFNKIIESLEREGKITKQCP